jgi:hypothetical protein
MRSPALTVVLALPLLSLFPSAAVSAQGETVVNPTVESVSTFKNGVAVIRASFRVEKPGVYVWQRPPSAIQGTFWVESDLKVNVHSTMRMLPMPEGTPVVPAGLQQELAGKTVTVTLKAVGANQPVTYQGRVWAPVKSGPVRLWDTNYASLLGRDPYNYYGSARYNVGISLGQPGPAGFLILENQQGGRDYISADTIASVSVTDRVEARPPDQPAPILTFDIADAPKEPATIHVSYLARGMAWVPSYRLELKGEDKLQIRLAAVVRNELLDLHDTELRLISGFPAMPFAHVDSPLWANGNLTNFFAQLNTPGGGAYGSPVVSQGQIVSNASGNNFDPNARGGAAGDLKEENAAGTDIHFESIGRHTLAAGDSLSVEVAHAECAFERVIDWVIKDKRDDEGRRRYENNNNNKKEDEDQPWDGVRFANPFSFPMTTGTAITLEGGDFHSQSTSYWMNPGQNGTLRTSKALTLKTTVTETEDESARRTLNSLEHWVQHKMLTTLRMQNFRDHPAKVIIRAEYSGQLVSADGAPEQRLRPLDDRRANLPRELEWTVSVPAKGEQTVQYSYTYLTR